MELGDILDCWRNATRKSRKNKMSHLSVPSETYVTKFYNLLQPAIGTFQWAWVRWAVACDEAVQEMGV